MSFQAYLDALEKKTGASTTELVALAHAKGFDETTRAQQVIEWLRDDYGVGRGHAMALVDVLKGRAGTRQ